MSASVAIPLYIYPEEHSWTPLYGVLARYPQTRFLVVVNPNNGPGGHVPDANYIKQVAQLNSFPNVTIFGYVHVSWGAKDVSLVTRDITTWSNWKSYADADLHVEGIFVDEAPSAIEKLDYMSRVNIHVKHAMGADAVVWTNPGVPVDKSFYAHADLVNCVENTHAGWQSLNSRTACSGSTAMVHSYTGTSQELLIDVLSLRQQGYSSILVSTETCYTSFSDKLAELVQAVSC